MVQAIKEASEKIVGLKQTLRAIQQERVQIVYIANDIEDHVTREITDACRRKNIPLLSADMSKSELGRICRIEVGAAIVALVK